MMTLIHRLNELLVKIGSALQSPFLLAMRLYWGWQFTVTGRAKLADIGTFAEKFAEWGIPMPRLNVMMAAGTECVGGALLLIGLFSRVISIPLICTMTVAYLTAHVDTLKGIWNDPDAFVSAPPFLFLLTALVVFIFGPGSLSVDRLIQGKRP